MSTGGCMNTKRGFWLGSRLTAATGFDPMDSGSRSGSQRMAISSKRWTIIEMRTPSRTDRAPSTLGVSGRKSSKSMYIRDLVDYITRGRAILDCDEHINDAKGQRHCTHGAKPRVPK